MTQLTATMKMIFTASQTTTRNGMELTWLTTARRISSYIAVLTRRCQLVQRCQLGCSVDPQVSTDSQLMTFMSDDEYVVSPMMLIKKWMMRC